VRVLVTHNMFMRDVRWLCEHGEIPRQHLWGADALEAADFDVELGPFGPAVMEGRGARRRQELALLRSGGLALVGDPGLASGLGRVRPGRVASFVHDVGGGLPPWLRRIRLALALSERGRAALLDLGRDPASTPRLGWGPDLGWPGYTSTGEERIVCAGKSNRDWPLLLSALAETGHEALVLAPRDGDLGPVPERVEVRRPPSDDPRAFVGMQEALPELARASVVAIPIADANRLTGLAELNDALAFGKPVVITRCDQLDVAVEAIGCGIAVEPGDRLGWVAALDALAGDAARRRELGERGRAWAARHWNHERFGADVVRAIESLA
jgi:glycosyltransferase involved in cell wall biosynthesis